MHHTHLTHTSLPADLVSSLRPVYGCACMHLPRTTRELQKLIESTRETTSPFHLSNASHITDTAVYVQPSASAQPETKKRKLGSGEAANGTSTLDDASHAKYPGKMVGNKHTAALHEQLKRECEILAENCVSSATGCTVCAYLTFVLCRTKSSCGLTFRCRGGWR